jgi:uncharacterized surface protein with fasciclin (FAS1) repeats
VRKIPRPQRFPRFVVGAGLLAALTIGVSACGSQVPDIPPPATQAPAPLAGAAPDGVTTPAQAFGPACQQLPQSGIPGSALMMANQPVATALATDPLAKTFAVAVQKANLVGTLNEAKSATVFVPYESAFTDLQQSLGPDRFNALLSNPSALADVLKYHVVVKRYDRIALVAARSVSTLQGGNLKINDAGDTVNITDNAGKTAHVLCGNLPTTNATIFLIDKVLNPQAP